MLQSDFPKGVIQGVQDQIKVRLAADELFVNVPVFSENTLDIDNRLDLALSPLSGQDGKAGLAALVLTPQVRNDNPNLPGPYLTGTVIVQIVENILTNQSAIGTKLPASFIAEAAAIRLHRWQTTLKKPLIVTALTLVPPSDKFPNHVLWNVSIKTEFALSPRENG
jgi:hypothetical protein